MFERNFLGQCVETCKDPEGNELIGCKETPLRILVNYHSIKDYLFGDFHIRRIFLQKSEDFISLFDNRVGCDG